LCEDNKEYRRYAKDPEQRCNHGVLMHGMFGVCVACSSDCEKRGWKFSLTKVADHDPVSHPKHYTSHPSGVECIQITEHMGFNLGNAIKYMWRADDKGAPIEDLKKAVWYIQREIGRREKAVEGGAR